MKTSPPKPPVGLSERIRWMPSQEVIIPTTQLVVDTFSLGIAASKTDNKTFVSMVINDELALCFGNDQKTLLAIAEMFTYHAGKLKEMTDK